MQNLPPITSFLSYYPHPAFILSAEPLKRALLGRRVEECKETEEGIPLLDSTGKKDSNESEVEDAQEKEISEDDREVAEASESTAPSEVPTRKPSISLSTGFDPHSTLPSHFSTLLPSPLLLPAPLLPSLSSNTTRNNSSHSSNGAENLVSKKRIDTSSTKLSTNGSNTSTSSYKGNNRNAKSSASRNSSVTSSSDAEQILADAFNSDNSVPTKFNPNHAGFKVGIENAFVGGRPNVGVGGVKHQNQKKSNATKSEDDGSESDRSRLDQPSSHSSLLEGGNQADHDPSRTAEGAVTAMYEMRQKKADEKSSRIQQGKQNQMEAIVHKLESEKNAKLKSSSGIEEEVNKKNKEAEMEVEQERRRNDQIRPLVELLKPIWGNSKWENLVSSKEKDYDLGLLGLLGRTDAQKLLRFLSNVLDSNSSELIDSPLNLTLNFPFQSIHYSPLSAKESASNLPNTFSGNSSSFSSQNSSSITTNGLTSRRKMELVATLYEGTDFLVITTVVSEIGNSNLGPPLLSRTTTEASTISNPSGVVELSSSVPTPLSASPLESAQSHFLSRPDHLQHHSSIGSTLSTSTVTSDSTSTTLSPNSNQSNSVSSPITIDARQPYSLSHRNSLLASHAEARSFDRTPNPAPQYSGAPGGTASTFGDVVQFPDGFVLERKSRRREKRKEKQLNISRRGKGRETLSNIGEASVEGSDVMKEILDAEDADAENSENETDGEDPDPDFSLSLSNNLSILDPNRILPSPPINDVNRISSAVSLAPSEISLFPPSTDPFLLNLMHTPMGRLIRAFPWETSPLGPILSWAPELKVMVTLCLATPFRNAIWCGPENVLIYNDEYAKISGAKHPSILGMSGSIAWAEIWDTLGPIADRVMQGETVSYYDHHLPMNRFGFTEETYYIWSFIPFRGADGTVLGYENPCFETTARVIAERRLSTIRDLVQVTSSARTVKEYCQKTLQSLASNPYDIVFCILYTVEATVPVTSKSTVTAKDNTNLATYRLNLEGSIGVPTGHSSMPEEMYINVQDNSTRESEDASDFSDTASGSTTTNNTTSSSNTSWPFVEACTSRKPVFISEDLENRTKGYERRGWKDPVKNALCIPIFFEDDPTSTPRAFLVFGLNPRRPWNDIFATFFLLLSRSIASGMFSVFVAESDAERANELAQLNRAKTNFFSNVSHELRTPLTLILGPLEDILASKDTLSAADRNRLVTVEKHAKRLLNMVNNLLDFSRLEGGKLQALFRPTKLSSVTADLGSLFRSAIERGAIEYIVDCEPDPSDGPAVFLSVELWEKIIFNLVGNAFKYTMNGTITLQVRYTNQEAIVKVIDTGCGIPVEEVGNIFERFHRVESTSRAREGTGIGLALTLELVKVLGGLLEVESELGKGSTFTVRLPRGSAHLPVSQVVLDAIDEDTPTPLGTSHNLSIVDEAASWRVTATPEVPDLTISSASSSNGSRTSMNSETQDALSTASTLLNLNKSVILLVDDNEDLRGYIAGILGKHFTVVQATDGLAALEYAFKTPPDLVVSDMQMPLCDGRQFLEKFRSNPKTKLIAVIFLSADASPETRINALNAGADDFLVKPFQSRELIARVQTHLTLGRMRIELEREVALRTEELVESEMKFRGLADRYSVLSVLSPVGVFMSDISGNLSYANPRWYEISGHPLDKPLSEWRDSVHPEDLEKTHAFFADGITAGRDAEYMEFRFRQGSWVQFELRFFQDAASIESGGGFVGAITDISRPKKLEALHIQIVDQRAADAEENRRQMELFIDMASHELRNPLSGVWQNAEVVGSSLERITEVFDEIRLEGTIPDTETLEDIRRELQENTEAVESIMLCAAHQGRIADDILNVSKLNMGLLSVNPVPFDLVAKMTEVLKMFEVECQQKQISLTLSAGSSLAELSAEWVVADPSRLAQIAINFLTNSVKYTSDAIRRKSIVIRIDAFKDAPAPLDPSHSMRVAEPKNLILPPGKVWVVVGVEDSGKGLSSEELKKLFLRFGQANPKSDQYGGSGLGLYVSRALAELHEGFIEVDSTPGEGSTFKFAIPAAIASPPTSSTKPETTLPTRKRVPNSSNSGTLPPASSSKMKQIIAKASIGGTFHVLVVEDNLINQKVMQRQLKMAKCLVTLAGNGLEALEAIQADDENKSDSSNPPIDIVLMDIEMPVMNGLEAIRELREREKSGVISRRYNVIAVTGNARQGQIDECLASGFDDVAIKPYKMTELLLQIHKLVDNDLTPKG